MTRVLAMIGAMASTSCTRDIAPREASPAEPVRPKVSAAAALSDHASDCPGSEDGSELVGSELPDWQLSDWSNSPPLALADLRGKVVLVRFWTTDCPYCEKTMPALEALWRELRGQPVVFVGAFHDKPAGSQRDMKRALESTGIWAITFPIAFDRGWKTLDRWWWKTAHRHATSATFVIGKDGRIVFVHPGPAFHPSADPAEASEDRDYNAVKQAVERALARS
jgi:peroxiredoxin